MRHFLFRLCGQRLIVFGVILGVFAAICGARGGEKAAKKPRGRLPAYYRLVVSEQQRLEIYRIQTEYRDRIEPLQQQLEQLKQERDAKIEGVLTEEQRLKVEEAVAEAKAQRALKKKKAQ